ncbi:hypothetical protein L228DRAFT_242273 [Xylona heveae TC161]|uniref:Amino acid permease/ SLC12A domain-containing protein n=1 Tax=Xylona heveae (strain CBS 132557 / TC161) TaxID=1328760 RepID=A0A165J8G6_XYLHT|nr:hypothetical protein L228DRAFT_242273 [Xylona heveae TC161]KZF25891.1 hypothetical protein L228DRAFT_242273 [Xylona heveae TC161]
MSVPSEISAAVVLIQYWTDLDAAIWITILIVITFFVAIAFIRVYAEIEFFFALLKILLVIGVIILGLVIDLGGVSGQDRIGFRYWKHPGPFVEYIASGSWGQFLGFWAVMSNAVYSFAGVESLAMAAAETKNPRQSIPRACKRVFARVTIFYVLAVLIVGMIVPSDDPHLSDESGTATQSPFVTAASRAGIKALPSIVNAVVLTSAWSAGNQSLLAGTRALYGLAIKQQAPKIFLRTTSWGTPYMCVLLQTLFMLLAYMSVSNSALTVFFWLLDLTAAGVLISWIVICFNHIRLLQAFKAQNISTELLPWRHWWSIYSSWFSLITCVIFLLTGGFVNFTRGDFSAPSFVSSYLDIPLVLTAFVAWKIYKRTRLVPLTEIPLQAAIDEIRLNPEVPIPEPTKWQKLNVLWG